MTASQDANCIIKVHSIYRSLTETRKTILLKYNPIREINVENAFVMVVCYFKLNI